MQALQKEQQQPQEQKPMHSRAAAKTRGRGRGRGDIQATLERFRQGKQIPIYSGRRGGKFGGERRGELKEPRQQWEQQR